MDQYIHDNTEDEFTHFTFINAYLASRRAPLQSTWINFALCRVVKRQGHSKSDGSQTSCSSPWIPVFGLGTAVAPKPRS